MKLDRRRFLQNLVGGATVVAAASNASIALVPSAAEAAPMALDKNLPKMMEEYAEKAQATVVVTNRGRRRRRRWRCWWRRGRRVCGWRYW